MANRFPLVVDASTSAIKELPTGDNLDLTGSGIVNAGAFAATSVTVSGQITGVTNLAMTGTLTGATNIGLTGTLTGATNIGMTGTLTGGTNTTISGTFTGAQVDILAEGDLRLQDASGGQYVALQAPSTIGASYTLTMPADDGDADQYLQTNGSGVLDWATVTVPPSAYAAFAIISTATSLAASGQYISNSSSALTHTLPAGAEGSSITVKNNGSGLVTLARTNNEKINGATANATMPQGNAAQLVYIDNTTGWLVL